MPMPSAETLRGLLGVERTILAELNFAGENGRLTSHLAEVLGASGKTQRARRRCRALAGRGLVVRHETNIERWFIADAGRALLAQSGEASR